MNFIGLGITEDSTRKVTSFSKSFTLLLISSQTDCVLSVLEEFLMSNKWAKTSSRGKREKVAIRISHNWKSPS